VDAKGDWKRAHESAQQGEGIDGSWIHAYLHLKEGDQDNAAYWTTGQASPFAGSRFAGNGSASSQFCWSRRTVQPARLRFSSSLSQGFLSKP